MSGGRLVFLMVALVTAADAPAGPQHAGNGAETLHYGCGTLRAAIEDLTETFGPRYPNGAQYLRQLDDLSAQAHGADARGRLERLKHEALLANPLLGFDRLLVVKRKSLRDAPTTKQKKFWVPKAPGMDIGFPSNHECNSSLPREGYDNEIAVLSLRKPEGGLATFYRPEADGYVGEMDLHWDARRLLFTRSSGTNWTVWEVRTDGTGLRRVSRMPEDVDCFDAC